MELLHTCSIERQLSLDRWIGWQDMSCPSCRSSTARHREIPYQINFFRCLLRCCQSHRPCPLGNLIPPSSPSPPDRPSSMQWTIKTEIDWRRRAHMTAHRPHQEEKETERNYKSTIGKVRGRQDFNELGLKRMLLSYNIIKGGRDGRRRSFINQPKGIPWVCVSLRHTYYCGQTRQGLWLNYSNDNSRRRWIPGSLLISLGWDTSRSHFRFVFTLISSFTLILLL